MAAEKQPSSTSINAVSDRQKSHGRHNIFEETKQENEAGSSNANNNNPTPNDSQQSKDKKANKKANKIIRNSSPCDNSQIKKKLSITPTVQKTHPWPFLFIPSSTSKKDFPAAISPNENSVNNQLSKKPSSDEELPSAKPPTKLTPRYENLTFPSGPCCRICHSGVSKERLISPCLCKGSLGHVHRSCLEQWLNQAGRSSCELCYHQFDAIESRRYGCCESANVWLQHPRHRSHVQADFLICALLTVVTAGLMAVCLLGMRYFVIEGLKLGITHTWTHGAITIFLALVILGYIVTLYLLVRDQIVPWYRWWKSAITVRLVLEHLENQQTTV